MLVSVLSLKICSFVVRCTLVGRCTTKSTIVQVSSAMPYFINRNTVPFEYEGMASRLFHRETVCTDVASMRNGLYCDYCQN